ncbi:hypothetical protein LCGC14_0484920 [marine sediment metagenome]|uniref:Uncharacterized protein n=1 Tax=marine sediment metagenome TaxID=412755 RepID=A0A0F9SDK1_9ZZZZ
MGTLALHRNKKGQTIIIGLVVMFIATIIWSILVPVLNPFLDVVSANATARGETGQALLISLVPLLGWFVIVIGYLAIVAGAQAGRQQ